MANTIKELRAVVAAYLQVNICDFTILVDEQNGTTIDLLLNAANNAKRHAQKLIDWQFEQELVYVTTDATGVGNWQSALRVSDDSAVVVKQPQTFYLLASDGTTEIPLYHHTKKHAATWSRERLEAANFVADRRYLSDDQISLSQLTRAPQYSDQYEIYILGYTFEMFPVPDEAKTIHIDALLWADDYTSNTDTDFFLDEGFDFMQWFCIVELNNRFRTFLPQQEGNLSPQVKERDAALLTLMEYNNFIVESGRQPTK